jgi:tRNA threonylcarbamoyladenosine biosynthesis protein TsaB
LCVIIDAKQNKVYTRFYRYRNGVLVSSSRIMLVEIKNLLDKLKVPVFFLGDGIKLYKDILLKQGARKNILANEEMWYPDAGVIGELGVERFRKKGRDSVFTLNPLYVYRKECQVVKKKRV